VVFSVQDRLQVSFDCAFTTLSWWLAVRDRVGKMVEYTEEDPKPQLEEECKVHCVREWAAYKACAERIKSDTTGQAHCSGQYFDFWKCIDHCAAPQLFHHLK
ncbi:hypothetical protein Agub_g7347, partial [Astrephomene gubernaculifera]